MNAGAQIMCTTPPTLLRMITVHTVVCSHIRPSPAACQALPLLMLSQVQRSHIKISLAQRRTWEGELANEYFNSE